MKVLEASQIRSVWENKKEESYVSVIDVAGVLG